MPIHRSQLPIIKLPQFNGDFSSWPLLEDLFASLAIDQQHLSNVAKLHYLKTSWITTFVKHQSKSQPSSQSQVNKSTSGKSTQPTKTAHHAASTSSRSTKYTCDRGKRNHYIVSCPACRELSILGRHNVIKEKRLCFNCFGHHNLRSRVSTRTCITCGSKHHTMIHMISSLVHNQRSQKSSDQPSATQQPTSPVQH
ncbi:hypothetical protein PV326_011431 [Microctonus aethiopoides]|nr:hypothetical protein PV326_011431 [Microctonus aethiopoides]